MWGECEEEEASVDFPEGFLAHEQFMIAISASALVVKTNRCVLAPDKTHALEFGQEMTTLEDALSPDADGPVSLGPAILWRG